MYHSIPITGYSVCYTVRRNVCLTRNVSPCFFIFRWWLKSGVPLYSFHAMAFFKSQHYPNTSAVTTRTDSVSCPPRSSPTLMRVFLKLFGTPALDIVAAGQWVRGLLSAPWPAGWTKLKPAAGLSRDELSGIRLAIDPKSFFNLNSTNTPRTGTT